MHSNMCAPIRCCTAAATAAILVLSYDKDGDAQLLKWCQTIDTAVIQMVAGLLLARCFFDFDLFHDASVILITNEAIKHTICTIIKSQ